LGKSGATHGFLEGKTKKGWDGKTKKKQKNIERKGGQNERNTQ